MKIAIIGAGFSGCLAYKLFREKNNVVHIFDKSRGCGGRLSTKYIEDKFCDYGTFSFKVKNDSFKQFCEQKVQENILRRNVDGSYSGFNGINKIASSLIDKKDLITQTRIVKIQKQSNKYILLDDNDKKYKDYDFIILTIPATQILEHDIPLDKKTVQNLQKVEYSSIFSLILTSKDEINIDKITLKSEFFKKINYNSLHYRYKDFNSLVLYVNEEYSSSNNHKTKEELKEDLLEYINYFQEEKLNENIDVIGHLWKYALVKKELKKDFILDDNIAICGDYFNGKNIQSAYLSVNALYKQYKSIYKK